MKTESTVMYILRLSLILFVIAGIVALALAGVNSITAPKIAELKAEKTQKAIETVLPGGFDNTITMMVGVDKAGNVLGIDIISHTETAGLGAVSDADTPAGIAFREQFIGASGSVSVTKDGGQMDAITGATITSRAICAGVNAALECVAQMG